ncbi:MAG: SsrA-binding protein SmpB [Nitrospinae bacterium]|nr:SsrA-binding protein SmpB [Nitrospinota bacterium]
MAGGKHGKPSGGGKREGRPLPSIQNRNARHNYHILESLEAGVALTGAEVKSIRGGKVQMKDAFARVHKGEVWLMGMHITPYESRNTFVADYDPMRNRKLLLHHRQIKKLTESTAEKGLALVPLKLYFKKGLVKIELGVGKGKKLYDKREDIKSRDAQREMDRAMRK